VRDRIIAETRGNPLALLELPRGLTATQLALGFGLVDAQTLPGRIEDSFTRRLQALSADARRLLLVAAAEPVGDPILLWRAAAQLRIEPAGADRARNEGLLAVGERVIFRHPLVRSAVYRSAAAEDRRAVHLALAEVTDRQADPDRRAWHLAAAATGPDEQVAGELERAAGRAQAGWCRRRGSVLEPIGRAYARPGATGSARCCRRASAFSGGWVRRGFGAAGERGGGASG
jgi:hypothetical protein